MENDALVYKTAETQVNYTLYQIAIPVMMVVLPGVGANVPLCLGAIISAGLFGANACVVSDLGVVSARACRVTIYDQYRTSQPYEIGRASCRERG